MKIIIRKLFIGLVFTIQISLLWISYAFFRLLTKDLGPRKEWAVGLEELAANVYNISRALGETVSVSMSRHPYYSYSYDHDLPARINWRLLRHIVRIAYSPILLGYLCHRVSGFFYVGGSSYLLNEFDGRSYEFNFLKSRGLKVACFFCGSEIRSVKLMDQLSKDMERDMISTYQRYVVPSFDADNLEIFRIKLAASADKYADHIFNASVDQVSYIRRRVHPCIYFYPESGFRRNDEKFAEIRCVKVVHGPSSPLIKGTPLVRAAIKKLKMDGYEFEYRELIGVSNQVMLEALNDAHVVLNEFYAFVPGQFGVEAMASHCALITSADDRIETSLPAGANNAWMVTEYWNIYDNLKQLLDDHALIKKYADSGFAWASKNCSYQKSAIRLKALLETTDTSVHA